MSGYAWTSTLHLELMKSFDTPHAGITQPVRALPD
jgi:hypothetical protein